MKYWIPSCGQEVGWQEHGWASPVACLLTALHARLSHSFPSSFLPTLQLYIPGLGFGRKGYSKWKKMLGENVSVWKLGGKHSQFVWVIPAVPHARKWPWGVLGSRQQQLNCPVLRQWNAHHRGNWYFWRQYVRANSSRSSGWEAGLLSPLSYLLSTEACLQHRAVKRDAHWLCSHFCSNASCRYTPHSTLTHPFIIILWSLSSHTWKKL